MRPGLYLPSKLGDGLLVALFFTSYSDLSCAVPIRLYSLGLPVLIFFINYGSGNELAEPTILFVSVGQEKKAGRGSGH
jgi:hypothetical protein